MTAPHDRRALLDEAREDEQPNTVHLTSAVPAQASTAQPRLLTLDELWDCRDGALPMTGMYEDAIQRKFAKINGFAEPVEQCPKENV